jgi:putative SOS response-associated peptidase YedK
MMLSFNVAPTHPVSAIIPKDDIRYLGFFRWGLIPSWMKEIPKTAMINIRSETISEKPSFKVSFMRRRCIVPANGFYEWRKQDKQPYFLHAAEGGLLYMAGIYDVWESPDGSYISSLGIITTPADSTVEAIHERMPLLLNTNTRNVWLDYRIQDVATLSPILEAETGILLTMYPISKRVNTLSNNDAECLQEIASVALQQSIF